MYPELRYDGTDAPPDPEYYDYETTPEYYEIDDDAEYESMLIEIS